MAVSSSTRPDSYPFTLAPNLQRKRLKHLQSMRDTFTLSLRNGELAMHSETFDPSIVGAQARAQGQFDFIKDVVKDIPNFDAVFSIHECVSRSALLRLACKADAPLPSLVRVAARRRSSSATTT